MITGAVKNKVDKIWLDIFAGGITNPLTVIEQLTYLMFIRSLDEREFECEQMEALTGRPGKRIFPKDEEGQALRWSRFKHRDAKYIYKQIATKAFPFIKNMNGGAQGNTAFARYMQSAMFLFPEENVQLIQKVVTGLDELYEQDLAGRDMQGDLYEYMLSKISTAGVNGQFRTPKHIREMMVRLVGPTPDDLICDPACGTAGFLVSSAEYIREQYEAQMTPEQWQRFSGEAFTGFDFEPTMLRISAMNLMLHSITHPTVENRDSLSKTNTLSAQYDVVFANPPFKGTVDAENISDNLKAVCETRKTELLFVALFLRLLKKGGRCACIVPDGVLFGSSRAHQALRRELVENHTLRAVISMPSGVFKPYAGVSTAVLVFTKTGAGGTGNVWFYDMQADGLSLDDKRAPVAENDIPDICARFAHLEAEQARARTERSFMVPKAEIVDKGYDLSLNRYKETVYEKQNHDAPQDILDRIAAMEEEIQEKLEELRGLLG